MAIEGALDAVEGCGPLWHPWEEIDEHPRLVSCADFTSARKPGPQGALVVVSPNHAARRQAACDRPLRHSGAHPKRVRTSDRTQSATPRLRRIQSMLSDSVPVALHF